VSSVASGCPASAARASLLLSPVLANGSGAATTSSSVVHRPTTPAPRTVGTVAHTLPSLPCHACERRATVMLARTSTRAPPTTAPLTRDAHALHCTEHVVRTVGAAHVRVRVQHRDTQHTNSSHRTCRTACSRFLVVRSWRIASATQQQPTTTCSRDHSGTRAVSDHLRHVAHAHHAQRCAHAHTHTVRRRRITPRHAA
jgi:hypothetical protein